ncbi:hypothetical protein CRM22_001582 [Opisthorchis felineus]|uniref:Acyltransferase 3 domain-containing protein n=1 Tax=Opisthorchis felineus TaxID=147828 RepID=A0A4S2MA04_OPIFE|nr:hypothetical protein CRM22_001582 [Opisthorchis felineus]
MTVTHLVSWIFTAILTHIARKFMDDLFRSFTTEPTADIRSPSSSDEGGEIKEVPARELRNDDEEYEKFRLGNALTYMRESFQNWPFQVMVTATLAVDTFYLMSGLLTFYLAAPRFGTVQESCQPRIWFWFIHAVHRFLRLTPPYLLVMFIYAGLFLHLYDGPLFPQRIELTDVNYCRQHWWIIYFSNFFYTKEQCLPWTWYLANEFQFSVFLAPVFITVMKWNPRVGVMFAVLLLTSSTASTFGIVYMNDSLQGHLTATSFESILVKPYTHWGTYTIGLLLGWILLQRKQHGMLPRNSRREQLIVGSALALVSSFCLSSFYGLGGATNTTEPHSLSKFTSALYTALSRPAFALEVAIVIYLCATDNAPHINALLSWSGFRLPSQLTYGLFLIHPIYVYLILLRFQTPITLSSVTLVILFLAVSVLSFISSFFLFLVTEIPVRTVEQFYGRR